MVMLLSGTIFLPVVTGILINMYTDGTYLGSGYVLLVCLLMQLSVGAILINRERQVREPTVVLMEAEDKCRELLDVKKEMVRRDEGYRMVRSAFDALNSQFCNMGENESTFWEGLCPIVGEFTASMWTVLGCTSNRYTIEAYFEYEPEGGTHHSLSGNSMVFFASPTVYPEQAIQLDNRHPAILNWHTGVGRDQNEISNLPSYYFPDGKRDPDLYFNRYAVVSIPTQCQSGRLGLLVLTADQEEPFAANVLDTLDFLATIVSAYHTKHEDCLEKHETYNEIQALRKEMKCLSERCATLKIECATYGVEETQQDVTELVQKLVKNEHLSFVVENGCLGGDPIPGNANKLLNINYCIGNTSAEKSFNEHDCVELP